MKISYETSLDSFKFWGSAEDHASQLTLGQLREVESILEDIYPDGLDQTKLNDIFAFDFETICEWLGIENQ